MKENEKQQLNMRQGAYILLFAIAANLVMQFVLSGVQLAVTKSTGKDIASSDYFQIACMLCLQVAFFVVPFAFWLMRKKQPPVLRFPLKPVPRACYGLLLAPLTILAFFFPTQVFALFLEKIGYTFSAGVRFNTAGKLVLGLFATVVLAPFIEELIFRGCLLSGLTERFGRWGAALLCGLSFSLMHMNPEQTVYQFFLGVVCALAVMESGSLLTGVVTHAMSNLLAILLDVTPLGSAAVYRFANFALKRAWRTALVTVLCAAAGVALLWLVLRFIKKGREEETLSPHQLEKGGLSPLLPYIAACVICAVMWAAVFAAAML